MKPGEKGKKFLTSSLILILLFFAAFLLLSGEKKKDNDEAGEKTNAQPANYTVMVSEESQKADNITTETLQPGLYQRHVTAYGQVLSPEGLSSSYKNYVAARSGLEKVRAQLKASGQEYARLKVLNANEKNISDRQLQAAAARLAADKAEEASAKGALKSAKNTIIINWGPTLAQWIAGYKPSIRRIIEAKDVLVQLTIPPSAPLKGIPKKVQIEPPAGGLIPARFVSRAASTNPNIQGLSFIYIAPSRSGMLVPGMNATAQMPSAGAQTGFFIPESAVIWLQDKAWVYVKKSETGFSRVEVPVSMPVSNGYFVAGVFSAGDRIVIKGAQALLSAESTPKAAGGGEEEDED